MLGWPKHTTRYYYYKYSPHFIIKMGKKKEAEVELAPKTPWHAMDMDAVCKELKKDSELVKAGLTTQEAKQLKQ